MIGRIAARLRQDAESQFWTAKKFTHIAGLLNDAGYSDEAGKYAEDAKVASANGLRLSRIAYTLEKISK